MGQGQGGRNRAAEHSAWAQQGLTFSLFLRAFKMSLLFSLALLLSACGSGERQIGIPPEAQSTIDAVTADITAERDEKVYQEAAEEWRKASTLDETKEFFQALRARLGNVKSRTFHMARGEENVGGERAGRALTIQYQTAFERSEGMETFTLVERDGRYLLARYFVNSVALNSNK